MKATVLAALVTTLLAAGSSTAAHAAGIIATVFDKNNAPMADAVLYAVPLGGAKLPPLNPKAAASVAQEKSEFVPYVTVVRTGTPVTFPNRDKHEHHLKSFGPAKEFEFKVYNAGTPQAVVFDKPGNSVLVCYLHGWMRAHVHAVDTPYFAKSDAAGAATLADLPAGDYEFHAWHPDMLGPPQVSKISLKQDQQLTMPIKFEHAPRKRPRAPKANYEPKG
jgi:plastocyanin